VMQAKKERQESGRKREVVSTERFAAPTAHPTNVNGEHRRPSLAQIHSGSASNHAVSALTLALRRLTFTCAKAGRPSW